MKLNKIYIASAFCLLLATSCSQDRLIESPAYETTIDTAIENEADMKALLNGIYNEYQSSSTFGADLLIFGDLISDNVFITNQSTDSRYRLTAAYNWSQDINEFSITRGLYRSIVLANIIINNTKLANTEEVNNMKGEAMIARAVSYYYLASFYSPTPAQGVNQEYGVVLNLENYDATTKLGRSTVMQVYDQIEKDLQGGIALMNNLSPINKGYLSPTAAKLLLSRVYLTRGKQGDAQKALDYANEVINSAGSNGFDFVKKDDYQKYFTSNDPLISENQPETIWEINMGALAGENPGVNDALAAYYSNTGTKKRLLFRNEFYQNFKSTDVRRGLFNPNGTPQEDTPKGVWTNKYVRTMKDGNFTQNPKIFRMSEAFLNKMEALVKLNREADALVELNAFSAKRGGNAYTSGSLENVLNERKKEFFGEGQRFFDLKRNNLGFANTTNCSGICEIPAGSKLFVFPISQTEMNVNPNMKQYPGY
ncbi:RagB/SusD family nutrient uptake outer membrane protein [Soonwooa sp.]|uniref:RagB/SusD family nutrient uptake outer membrane protein n=1 Tax=Soonwooa sp. TaxID=1938592 RepID=UPI00289ED242|nr:RagB/SusD family nutrient uptake outer membrane protein [Soonwooa sp.]